MESACTIIDPCMKIHGAATKETFSLFKGNLEKCATYHNFIVVFKVVSRLLSIVLTSVREMNMTVQVTKK